MCKAFKFTALPWRKQKTDTHINKCTKYFRAVMSTLTVSIIISTMAIIPAVNLCSV